jgi:hypothetical protein
MSAAPGVLPRACAMEPSRAATRRRPPPGKALEAYSRARSSLVSDYRDSLQRQFETAALVQRVKVSGDYVEVSRVDWPAAAGVPVVVPYLDHEVLDVRHYAGFHEVLALPVVRMGAAGLHLDDCFPAGRMLALRVGFVSLPRLAVGSP